MTVWKLVKDNRDALLHLTAAGIVPAPALQEIDTPSVSALDIQDILRRMAAGERPFEDWMYAHGHSDEDIAEIYGVIDRWLMRKGIISKPGPLPTRIRHDAER